MNLATQMTF